MKQQKSRLLFAAFFVFANLIFLQSSTISQNPVDSAELTVSTQKQEFLLGEPIELDVFFKRKGKFDLRIIDLSVADAGMKLYIAGDDNEFKRYKFLWPHYSSGRRKAMPDGSIHSSHIIFFDSKQDTTNLSDRAIKHITEGRILTDYAFPKPGTYRLKASVAFDVMDNSSVIRDDSPKIVFPTGMVESKEITIKINQPEGDDLKVWKIIESDLRIGHFMTAGSAPNRNPSIGESLMSEIDKIVADYPDSYLAGILSDKVAERRSRNENNRFERQLFDEKVKRAKDPRQN